MDSFVSASARTRSVTKYSSLAMRCSLAYVAFLRASHLSWTATILQSRHALLLVEDED